MEDNSGLLKQIETAIVDLFELPFGDTVQRTAALHNLVSAVEPYLKSVGRLRHARDPTQITRLEQASLKALLEQGMAFAPISWDPGKSARNHDADYWSNQDCTTAIAYSVWRLRNEMAHESLQYDAAKVSDCAIHVMCLLLFVISERHNMLAAELATCSFREHLRNVANTLDPDFERYVSLDAALTEPPLSQETAGVGSTTPVEELLPGPVKVEMLAAALHRFVLMGVGGSGKSRTLRHLTAIVARESMVGACGPPILPIFVPAFALLACTSVEDALSRLLRSVPAPTLRSALDDGRCFLAVDALNEVAPQDLGRATQLLLSFLLAFPRCRIVIATRRESYTGAIPLPAYQLQGLEPADIRSILRTYALSETRSGELFSRIQSDPRLMALFRTPLMSRLLTELPRDIQIPRNVGEMMSTLFGRLIEREHTKEQAFPRLVVEAVIGHCARVICGKSGNLVGEDELLEEVTNALRRLDPVMSPARLLWQAVACGILERDQVGRVAFSHESVLDYFLALSYRTEWTAGRSDPLKTPTLPPKNSAIEILAGLLTDAEALINAVLPDLVLAARCYGSCSRRSEGLFTTLYNLSVGLLDASTLPECITAMEALAALDEPEATRAIYQGISRVPPSAIETAKNMLVEYSPAGSSEEARNALEEGRVQEHKLALYFIGRTRLIEASAHVIRLARAGDAELAEEIAEALARLDTPDTFSCISEQIERIPTQRTVRLDVAIMALAPERVAQLLPKLVVDSDAEVRHAAVTRCCAIDQPSIIPTLHQLLATDTDFTVRLIAGRAVQRLDPTADQTALIRAIFAAGLPREQPVPSASLLGFLSQLHGKDLEEVLLQAMCQPHAGVQSLVVARVLARATSLALDLINSIELSDPSLTSGAKIALVEAAIRAGRDPEDTLQRVFAGGVQASARVAALRVVAETAPAAVPTAIAYALQDTDVLVRARAPILLSKFPGLITAKQMRLLLNDPARDVHRPARKLLAHGSFTREELLLELANKGESIGARIAAVTALVHRGYRFPLKAAYDLTLDANEHLRRVGLRVMRAIARSRSDEIGIITEWNGSRESGYIRRYSGGKVFFHLFALEEPAYTPHAGDLVSFHAPELRGRDRFPTARNVRLQARLRDHVHESAAR